MTWKGVLFTPAFYFRNMPVTGGITDPLLFALITGMTGVAFFFVWDILLHDVARIVMAPEGDSLLQGFGIAAAAVAAPVLLMLALFGASGALHVLLFMVRGARAGFEATFRVVCYGTSPMVFLCIPYCGMPLTLVWIMTLVMVGLKEAHQTTGGRVAFAVFFPLLFFCGLITLGMAMFMGAVAASFGDLLMPR